ncbi:hypothetical protein K435DRAFT_877668, partial [Dendrothele bispora CBS 962.96]
MYLITWGQIGSDKHTRKYWYINGESHNHSRYTRVLHFTAQEEADVGQLAQDYPDKKPIELLVGPKTMSGRKQGAASIAQAANNPDSW